MLHSRAPAAAAVSPELTSPSQLWAGMSAKWWSLDKPERCHYSWLAVHHPDAMSAQQRHQLVSQCLWVSLVLLLRHRTYSGVMNHEKTIVLAV